MPQKSRRHPRAIFQMLPHLPHNTSTRSLSPTSTIFRPYFPSLSCSTSAPSGLDQDTLRDPRWSGRYTKSASPTRDEPKLIQSDDYELQGIELDRNIGTDAYQIPERILGDDCQNLITEYTEETGKFGVDMPYVQSRIHTDYDSAESIADSDLEHGELRKCWPHRCM